MTAFQIGQFGQHPSEQLGKSIVVQSPFHAWRSQQLENFISDALTRQPAEHLCAGPTGGKPPGVHRFRIELCVEAKKPQYPQRVLANTFICITNETNLPRFDIRHAAQRIEHISIRIGK